MWYNLDKGDKMRNYVIGTAGHIDHGKTTLIQHLTGVNTDTLKEEQERGITVNLGFTYLNLLDDLTVGVIDVPGHEKLIKNMLSGVCGIDLVLFVVAANDGIMPQTREHFEILRYLKLKNVIVVLTKTDLVDRDQVDLVKLEIEEEFGLNSFVEFNIKDNNLIDNVKTSIIDNLSGIDYQLIKETYRMTVDRAFNVTGHGVVITGTSLSGEVKVGDSLELLPSKKLVKVKGIQAFKQKRDVAYKRMRVALNIGNVKLNEVSRGMIISTPSSIKKSNILDCKLTITKDLSNPIKHLETLYLYYLASEIKVRVKLLNQKEVGSNEVYCQLLLDEEIYCASGDLAILRRVNPNVTLAGVEILNVLGSYVSRKDESYVEVIKKYESNDSNDIIESYLKKHPFSKKQQILDDLDIESFDSELYVNIDRHYLLEDTYKEIENEVVSIVNDFHKSNPYEDGINKVDLLNKLNIDVSIKVFTKFLRETSKFDVSNLVKKKGYKIPLNEKDAKLADEILDELYSYGYQPPKVSVFIQELNSKKKEDLFFALVKRKDIVRIDEDFYLIKQDYDELIKNMDQYFTSNEVLDIGNFRDMYDVSRKYIVAYLEHLDTAGYTKRTPSGRVKK